MRRQGRGQIIFTTSIAGVLGLGKVHGYTASKSGLVGLTRSLASELGEYGITCNGILPGYFETDLMASYLRVRITSLGSIQGYLCGDGAGLTTLPAPPFSLRPMQPPT
jgi:NAD(P)-dependent dehydrogenase (short-subunit alcohol dehydrogenase family)